MSSTTPSPGTDVLAETTWYPQRSGLRYRFVATIEVLDPKTGAKVESNTSNLSSYGCHVSTESPFQPGTMVTLTISANGKIFRSEGKVIYSIRKEGMGIRFDNIHSGEQIILNEWLLQASNNLQERRSSAAPTQKTSALHKIVLALSIVGLAAIVVALFAWFGILH